MSLSPYSTLVSLPLLMGMMPVASAVQSGGNITVVYSEVQTDSSSSVTGIPGLFINMIERPYVSADGSHWMVTVSLDSGSTTDNEVLIRDGVVMVREGTGPAYLPAGRLHGFIDTGLAVANSGAFVFSGDISGSTITDDLIFMGDAGGVISILAQEDSQILGGPAGWTNDNVDSPILTNAGPGYQTDSIGGGPPLGQDELIMLNGAIFLQAEVDAPAGQLSGGQEMWDRFDFETVFVSSDGAHSLIQGDLTGGTLEDDVVVVDGNVVLQENYAIPGGNPADLLDQDGIRRAFMADSGDWVAHGDFDITNDAYAVYNGALVAREGQPIFAGSTEVYDSVFTFSTCNSVGDYVLAGRSDVASADDQVVVLNGSTLICREGDPVDLNGNGAFDDDTFISSFEIDEAALTNDLRLHMVVSLKDGSGMALGEAYLIVNAGSNPGNGTFCDPADDNSTGVPTMLAGTMGSGVGSGLHLEATQGPNTQFAYFLIGTGVADPGLAISQGHLCLSVTGGNSFGRYNVVGGVLNSVGQFNAAGVLVNAVGTSTTGTGYDVPLNVPIPGITSIMAGETWHFQLWHRENGGESNFSNGVSAVF